MSHLNTVPMYTILDRKNGKKRQVFHEDDVKMALGFLDTNELMSAAAFKAFVALVKLTRPNIQSSRKFAIPVKQYMDTAGIDHNNYPELDRVTDYLMRTILKYNVSDQDKTPGWKKSQFLGPTELEKGVIYGEFPEPIWEKMKDPKVLYTYIVSKDVMKMSSKYEVALYNWFLRLLFPNYSHIVCEITVESLKENVLKMKRDEKQTYSTYAGLNEKLLKPYIASLTRKTGLKIEYKIKERVGRSVHKLTFIVERNVSEIEEQQRQIAVSRAISDILHAMAQYGLSIDAAIEKHILDVINDMGEEACLAHLQSVLHDFKASEGQIKNPGGFLRKRMMATTLIRMPASLPVQAPVSDEQERLVGELKPIVRNALNTFVSREKVELFRRYLEPNLETYRETIEKLVRSDKALAARWSNPKNLHEILDKPQYIGFFRVNEDEFDYQSPENLERNVLLKRSGEIVDFALNSSELQHKERVLLDRAAKAKISMKKALGQALEQIVEELQLQETALPA